MSTWYYAGAEREQLGPLSTDELKQHYRSGHLTSETLVWRDGMVQWRALGDLVEQLGLGPVRSIESLEVALAPPVIAPPLPREPVHVPESASVAPGASIGRAVFSLGSDPGEAPPPVFPRVDAVAFAPSADDTANPYAAGHAPLHPQAIARTDEDVVMAGFWKRTAASILDGFILSIVGGLCGELLGVILADLAGGGALASLAMVGLCTLLINVCYFAWFHSTLNLATPGKMAIGIKVVRGNGESIGFLRGVARYFATVASMLTVIGVVMAGFTRRKQALHDLMCDTLVVDKWAYTANPEQQRSELGTVAIVVLAIYGVIMLLAIIGIFFLGMAGAMLRS